MPASQVSLEIPENELARTRAAAEAFTGLGNKASAKELLAACAARVIEDYERQHYSPVAVAIK